MTKKPNILAIIAKAKDKLKTSCIDFQHEQYDDAVSRAYYAVFHMITAALYLKGMVFSSHAQTIGAFNKEYVKAGIFPRSYTRFIQDLFDDRQTGDYDIISRIDREAAEKDVQKAEEICKEVEDYLLTTIDEEVVPNG